MSNLFKQRKRNSIVSGGKKMQTMTKISNQIKNVTEEMQHGYEQSTYSGLSFGAAGYSFRRAAEIFKGMGPVYKKAALLAARKSAETFRKSAFHHEFEDPSRASDARFNNYVLSDLDEAVRSLVLVGAKKEALPTAKEFLQRFLERAQKKEKENSYSLHGIIECHEMRVEISKLVGLNDIADFSKEEIIRLKRIGLQRDAEQKEEDSYRYGNLSSKNKELLHSALSGNKEERLKIVEKLKENPEIVRISDGDNQTLLFWLLYRGDIEEKHIISKIILARPRLMTLLVYGETLENLIKSHKLEDQECAINLVAKLPKDLTIPFLRSASTIGENETIQYNREMSLEDEDIERLQTNIRM